ncbi:MAG: hypothetical protein K2M07_00230 [Muribaculaceae bacterium]|nr:hypothetical protein [Muribaculaceae bacterium]
MMNEIFSHIEFLLYRHDCVIVPQLGAFMVRHIPAEYNPVTSTFIPPRRQILFNQELTHSDGLLIASVARRNRISYEQAAAEVTDEVMAIKSRLATPDSRCPAGSLGLMLRLPHGALTFEPAHRYFNTPLFMGFPEIEATTVEQRMEADNLSRKSRTLTLSGFMRVAASIILLIIVGLLTTTPLPVNETELNLASLALPKISMPEQQKLNEIPVEITLNIALPADTVESRTKISEVELAGRLSGKHLDLTDPYYLVVGSGESVARVRSFIAAHPGHRLETVNHNGNIRVIAATGNSPQSLMDYHRDRLKDEFPDAWTCHR